MNMETLTIQNAPRDKAALAQKGAYKLRKLATELGQLNDPAHKSAFINGKPDEMADVVLHGLRSYDAQNGGPQNGAPVQTTPQVMQQPATPPPAVMAPVTIPGAVSMPTQPQAQPETPAPAAKRTRQPQTSNDGGEVLAVIKELKVSLDNNTAAINALAQTTMGAKSEAEKAVNNTAVVYQLLTSMQKQQAMGLSLIFMMAEQMLDDGQGALATAAIENQGYLPDVFGGKG